MDNERVWLIRTLNNQVLGPVSKKKISDLLKKQMLTDEDEICSGNGFWFFLRELEMVERFINQGEKQPFDLISDVKSILGEISEEAENIREISNKASDVTSIVSLNKLKDLQELAIDEEVSDGVGPNSDDLEFPNVDGENSSQAALGPSDDDLEFPEVGEDSGQNTAGSSDDEITDSAIELEGEEESTEQQCIPDSDDLDFPDVSLSNSTNAPAPIELVDDQPSLSDSALSGDDSFTFEIDDGTQSHDDNQEFTYPKADDLEMPTVVDGQSDEGLAAQASEASLTTAEEKPLQDEQPEVESDASGEDLDEGVVPNSDDLEFPEI